MNVLIPFNETIDFRSNIADIISISLEHDYNINDGVLLGNFYVSGEYKSHEVAVNVDTFNYTLPFSIDLDEDIIYDTLEFNIENFTYDTNSDKLNIHIDYSLKGELKEKDEILTEVGQEDILDLIIDDEKIVDKEDDIDEREVVEDTQNIVDTIKSNDNEFVTYHIHIVKMDETKETISTLYNIPINIIQEYNDIDNLNIGDKIIIPDYNE